MFLNFLVKEKQEHAEDCQLTELIMISDKEFWIAAQCKCFWDGDYPKVAFPLPMAFFYRWRHAQFPWMIPPRGLTSGSSESVLLVKEWMLKCETTHELCGKLRECSWYPSRLLDLQPADCKSADIRLVITKEQPIEGR